MNRIVYSLLCLGILNNVSGNDNPGATLWSTPPEPLASVTPSVPIVPPNSNLPTDPTLPTSPSLPSPPALPTTPPLTALPALPALPKLPTLPAPPTLSALPTNLTLMPPLDPASNQLEEFRIQHPLPIGVLTTSAGKPVEVRESVTLNTDVFNNAYFFDQQTSVDQERIPERVVHTKGTGAFGYFEVTHDVSKYTKAEVFNGIGKRTRVFSRFSVQLQNLGGNELTREIRGMSNKFYTNEGNLDFLCLSVPIYVYRNPNMFPLVVHAFKRNPKTNLYDASARADVSVLIPDSIHSGLWLLSDFGQPNGYRKFDAFPIQTYEVNNKHGESYFVRFNFRTEQGVESLTEESARILGALDSDYSARDLYNAIERGDFPAWRLEMDVISKEDIKKLNYNPFDVTRLWENGTYATVNIGRLVLNRNPDNFFRNVEQSAYNPGNLVPGIPGPPDDMFKARRLAYRDAQSYRLGINHNNIDVNRPKYSNVYNRDGAPSVRDNMRDAPNYYENSFNGPVPNVDTARPREKLMIYDRNAVDLQPSADFYNNIVTSEGGKTRLAAIIGALIVNATPFTQERFVKIMFLIDRDLGTRVTALLATLNAARAAPTVFVPIDQNPRVVEVVPNPVPQAG